MLQIAHRAARPDEGDLHAVQEARDVLLVAKGAFRHLSRIVRERDDGSLQPPPPRVVAHAVGHAHLDQNSVDARPGEQQLLEAAQRRQQAPRRSAVTAAAAAAAAIAGRARRRLEGRGGSKVDATSE